MKHVISLLLLCILGAVGAWVVLREPKVPLETLMSRLPEMAHMGGGYKPEKEVWIESFERHGDAAIPILREQLSVGDPDVHALAAFLLARQMEISCLDESLAPVLAELFRKTDPVRGDVSSSASRMLRVLDGKAAGAVIPLVELAASPDIALDNKFSAMHLLGEMGGLARGAVPRLRAIASGVGATSELESHRLRSAAERTIIRIGGRDAFEILIKRLEPVPIPDDLQQLAELGEIGKEAVPNIIKALSHPYWEGRVAAARALGFIGDESCIDPLRDLLKNDEDWRLAFVAAESLGRLNARSAVHELESVEQSHWFPPVREAARKARRVVAGKDRYEAQDQMKNFQFEFFIYKWPWIDNSTLELARVTPVFEPEPGALTGDELQTESFVREVNGPIQPVCGLRIDRGLLLGADGGEWGGGLAFRGQEGENHRLPGNNVVGIHRMKFGVVAAEGYAHMDQNEGHIFLVDVDAEPIPTARIWTALPGAPMQTGRLANGSLFISCVGGDVVISPDGEIAMATEETVGRK